MTETLLEMDRILTQSVEEAIEKNERDRRVLIYRIPVNLPSIRNSAEQTTRKMARSNVKSSQQVVVERPGAESDRQLVEQPNAERKVTEPVDLQNVVAQNAPKTPARKAPIPETPSAKPLPQQLIREAPPELGAAYTPLSAAAQGAIVKLPKPAAKKFVPPQMSRPNVEQGTAFALPDSPQVSLAQKPALDMNTPLPLLPKIAPRKFPQPSQGQPRPSTVARNVEFGAMPSLTPPTGAPAEVAIGGPVGTGLPKMPPKRFTPPGGTIGQGSGSPKSATASLEAPPAIGGGGQGGSQGNQASQLVVIGLNPGRTLPPPKTNLQGSFSRGGEAGPPAHVANDSARATPLAGISTKPSAEGIENLRLASPQQILGAEAAEGYFEIRLELTKQWPRLSVALPPTRRMLPRRIEPYFLARSVYTVVIPIERQDRYTGDWIIWFSPKGPAAAKPEEGNARMETPLPMWKLESRRWLVTGGEQGVEQRVQLFVEISKEGRIRLRELMGRYGTDLNQLITNDVSRWIFQPARLNGQAIDVEAILEIPFRIPGFMQPHSTP